MAMRLTGINSGLDTETIIQELVSAKQIKVDEATKAKTKLEWKQDAWKDLSKKLKGLQASISDMRFSSAYTKKTTKVSNSNAVSVIAAADTANSVQSLEIKKLAKTAYLTGSEVSAKDGSKATALTKVSDLGSVAEDSSFTVTVGDKTKTIEINAETTISDVLTELKNCGLNASFDYDNQRIFVSAKESGAENNFSLKGTGGALTALGLVVKEGGATKINGQDAEIELNGATFTSSNNVFEINGLTITALQETKEGESITLTTQNDTEGIYDMIKGFLKKYNEIINEMDKLYSAEEAEGYEPLTDDEKYAMSEKQIEEWEEKIKESLLRKDSNLSSVSSTLKEVMMSGITVNGETMYLTNFGINTLGYFNAEDNERNAYHIDGDPDDEDTSSKTDLLGAMITKDPDTVVSFFSQLSQKLYSEMDNMSKAVTGYRSYGSFFDDKKMQSDYNDYTSKIKTLEEKLIAYEDKWYAKFSAMETALAKMQSNSSAVTSLLGGV